MQITSVTEALVEKFPGLKEHGSFAGMYGWQQHLKYKRHNFHTKLKSRKYAYPELEINTVKRPAKNVKKVKDSTGKLSPTTSCWRKSRHVGEGAS